MDIFLTAQALHDHWDLLEGARPAEGRWLTLDQDGTIRYHGSDDLIDPTQATPEVAWFSADIYDGGPLRPFFGLVSRSASLRWLQSSAAGVDAPIFARLVDQGVRLTTSHITGPPIADFVLRSALDFLQDADAWRQAATKHDWQPHEFIEMGSTRWLVIGLGAIGSEVAVRARVFGAHVTGVRRHPDGTEPVDAVAALDQVLSLLAKADVTVLAVPATPSTIGLVNREFLAAMKPSSLLINVGRGSLVDETALIQALDAGQLGGAVLDVVATEPLPADHPLWSHEKVVITPHSSAQGDGRFRRAAEAFAGNLKRYVAGDPLTHEVRAADFG